MPYTYTAYHNGERVARAFLQWGHKSGVLKLFMLKVEREYRGKGYGGQLLDLVCAEADTEHFGLELYAQPHDMSPLTIEQTIAFYAKRGFESYSAKRSQLLFRPCAPGPLLERLKRNSWDDYDI